MCIICVDWQKGKMTNNEAKRALMEMVNPDDVENLNHLRKLYSDIEEKEEKDRTSEGAD